MDDVILGVRRRLAAGTLPAGDCLVGWYRPGRGEVCVACDRRVLGTELDIHCDLADGRTVHFHVRCYGLWLRARREGPAGGAGG